MSIEQRVKALESKLLVDADDQPEGVFCYCVDGRKNSSPDPLLVVGWHHGEDRIMRMEGESDDDLNKRAIAQVKPSLGKSAIPVFLSIN